MKKFFKAIKNIFVGMGLLFVVSFFVDIRIEGHSLNQLFLDAGKNTYQFVDDMVDWFKKEPTASDFKIRKDEENQYFAVVTMTFVSKDELLGLTIDDVYYDEFEIIKSSSTKLVVEIPLFVSFEENEPNQTLVLTSISYERKNMTQLLELNLKAFAFKSLDDAIVTEKSKSVVGIRNCTQDLAGVSCKSWGSGVIFDMIERTVQVSPLTTKTYYDYYILTNAHVVLGGDHFQVYFSEHTYKAGGELVGLYTIDTDLAIIKITYDQKVLTVLDDDQFITKTPVDLVLNQTIFAVGSPGGPENFNDVKEGVVVTLDYDTFLDDQDTLCQTGCDAFQTSASQGPGSSGGAVFDTAGRLVGIHFAGDKDNTISSDIPMYKVLEAITHIMSPIYNEINE
jgi:S1-C subfamily serine protease